MRILTIQHAGVMGGSCISLLYTIVGLRSRGHECVVALARPNPEISAFYEREGFEVLPWKLTCWDHSTGVRWPLWNPYFFARYINMRRNWNRVGRRTLDLVYRVRPDVVHLNAMPLSLCADALDRAGIPFVWHVRECPPDQSLRTRRIRQIMRRAPGLVFLSDHDRRQWMGESTGNVVHNFVDPKFFSCKVDRRMARDELGLAREGLTILYLGGPVDLKGWHILLDALAFVKTRIPDVSAIMPGTQWQPARTWKGRVARKVLPYFGTGLPIQRFENKIAALGLQSSILRIPFDFRVERLISASDILVFPAIEPHFARPIIEAAAMGRPSIASDLGGIDELVSNGITGLLTKPGCPHSLATAIVELGQDSPRMEAMGAEARRVAIGRFDSERQIARIEEILQKVRR